jgi:hypothetical protein
MLLSRPTGNPKEGNFYFYTKKAEVYILGKKDKIESLKVGDKVLIIYKLVPNKTNKSSLDLELSRIVRVEQAKK